MSDQDTKMWANVYRSFIHYNERSLSYLQSEMKQVLAEPDKTVGVIYRGCAYTKGKAKGHPIQPSMKMLADKVQEVMTRNGCSYIYVASDEKSIVEYMNMRFPEQVLVNKRMYYDEVDGLDFTKYNEGNQLFDITHQRYIAAADAALDRLMDAPVLLEVNTGAMARGYRSEPYPTQRIRQRWLKAGKELILSSDCHDREKLLFGFEELKEIPRKEKLC